MNNRYFIINTLALLFLATAANGSQFEVKMIDRLEQCSRGKMTEAVRTALLALATREEIPRRMPILSHIPPLFTAYPALKKTVPYLSLGVYPTPVTFCTQLSEQLGVTLFVKEDGKAGPEKKGRKLFSGNKLRKLEFLLADAQAHGCKGVITRGGTGSNHALATSIYAKELGMLSTVALGHQPNAKSVQRALLLQQHYEAIVKIPDEGATTYDVMKEAFVDFSQWMSGHTTEQTQRFPYIIPTGGSCDRGALGFVNAAFELKKQIEEGIMKEPDFIFAAVGVGSGGSTAGLLLGLRAAGLKCQLVGVATEPVTKPDEVEQQTKKLFEETNALLIENDPSFPRFAYPSEQFTVITDFGGADYGLYTKEGMAAKELLDKTEHITLDGTYTAKTFAALLAYVKQHNLKDKTILFWNTYCGDDFSDLIRKVDYHILPATAHCYFETDVQELDK